MAHRPEPSASCTMNFALRAFLLVLALAYVLVTTLEGSDSGLPLSFVNNRGFCPDGVYGGMRWPNGKRPDGLYTWGSFCAQGDDNVGRVESQNFVAPSALELYLAGYPGLPGRRLILKNV